MGRKPGKTEKVRKAEAEIENIIQRYESREQTIREIAEEYDVSQVTMQQIIRQYYERTGRIRPVFYRRISPNEVAAVERDIKQIVERYENGEHVETIANEYGVCSATIRRKIKKHYEMTKRGRTDVEETPEVKTVTDDGRRILYDEEIVLNALRKGSSIPQILECARQNKVFIPGDVLDKAFEQWKKERDLGGER